MNETAGFIRRAEEWPTVDMRILSRANGNEYADGRTVEALIAVWDRETEIVDSQGHYMESITRTAFDRILDHARPQGSRSSWNVGVFYNHAQTMHGTPSSKHSLPIGSPIDIRADAAGLVTVTHYNNTSLATDVLEAIRNGDITGHSFSGRFIKSDPARVPRQGFRASSNGTLTSVRRLELGLREYGPTPVPAYTDTAVLSVRSFSSSTPNPDPDVEDLDSEEVGTPDDSGPATEDPQPEEALHSSRSQELTRAVILRKIAAARVIYPGLRDEGES